MLKGVGGNGTNHARELFEIGKPDRAVSAPEMRLAGQQTLKAG